MLLVKKTAEEIHNKHSIAKTTLYSHHRDILKITQTKTIKAALIEIIFSMPDMAKQWVIRCLLVLWLFCNGMDFSYDTTYEDVEGSTTTYE